MHLEQPPPGKKTLTLIDGMSLIYRAYYAFIRNPLMTSGGFPTSAIFGFTRFLVQIFKELKPTHAALILDAGRETFRTEIFPDYKAHREAMPDDLQTQIPPIVELVENCGLKVLSKEGFEADDLIGTLARQANDAALHTIIITGDRDLLQLVNRYVTVIRTVKGLSKTKVYDEFAFQDDYGITPLQFIDVKALSGDTSDNIPGIPGIGEKTALKLIRQFGSIETLLERLDDVKGDKKQRSIADNVELLTQSRLLCRINIDVPLEAEPDDLAVRPADGAHIGRLLKQYEIHSLKKELEEAFHIPFPPEDSVQIGFADGSALGAEDSGAMSEPEPPRLILTAEDLERMVTVLAERDSFAFLPVVADPRPLREDCIGIAVAAGPGKSWYIPFGHLYLGAPVQLSPTAAETALKPLLEDGKKRVVYHDFKLALRTMNRLGVRLVQPAFDTLLAAYLLAPSQRSYEPEALAGQYLPDQRLDVQDSPDPKEFLKKSNPLDETTVETALAFFGQRALDVLGLAPVLEKRLDREQLTELLGKLELPLSSVLAQMERTGIGIEPAVLRELSRTLSATIEDLENTIYDDCGCRFNLNSPKQLGEVLYDKMQLPQLKSKRSTAADILVELASMGYAVAGRVLTYREAVKLKSTYLDALPQEILPRTKRIHTTFHQTATATGRLSSASPNLQNIPIRGTLGKQVRKAFIPRDGWSFLSLDYSQIELRILAHITADPLLTQTFRSGGDIHTTTAAEIFRVRAEDVTPDMRREAKVVNFGILYGMSPFGLAQELKIGQAKARDYIKRYFERYPDVDRYTTEIVEKARVDGYVCTLMGRRRFVPELKAKNHNTRSFGERIAINTPIQGTSADLIKKAMIEVHTALTGRDLQARLLLQIHDELLFELPPEELAPAISLVEPIMRGTIELDVPIVLDIKTGPNWLELTTVDQF